MSELDDAVARLAALPPPTPDPHDDLVKLLEDAKDREWITGRDPADHETTICIRIIESDRLRLLKGLAALTSQCSEEK